MIKGLIPFKTVHGQEGVHLTWGLPFVRTSVDHGTAFDIAGKDKADPTSMRLAIKLAVKLSGPENHMKDGEVCNMKMNQEIFREYDIRGVVDKDFDAAFAHEH